MSTIAAETPYVARLSTGSKAQRRAGHILSTLVALFMAVDGGARIIGFAPYLEGTVRYGYAAELAPWLGGILLVSTAVYMLPRTAVLGAILITGYLGGATATHLRAGEPWFFPVVMGAFAWGGLLLSDDRARALVLDSLRGAEKPALARGNQ